jgi:hypothetical protein
MAYNSHECDKIPKGVHIFIDKTGELGDTRTCLDANILADNGATSHSATLYQIKYCPYCGKKLMDEVE